MLRAELVTKLSGVSRPPNMIYRKPERVNSSNEV